MKNKAIIMIGPDASGKSRKARELTNLIPANQSIWLDGRSKFFEKHYGEHIKVETKIIVIDDILNLKNIDLIKRLAQYGFKVKRVNKKDKIIRPQIIVTCNSSITREEIKKVKAFGRTCCLMDFFK